MMDSAQMAKVIDILGIPAGKYVRLPYLRTIIMETNMGIDPRRQMLRFDMDNGLIEIKRYRYDVKSGKIPAELMRDDHDPENDGKTTLKVNGRCWMTFIQDRYLPFRKPMRGDDVFYVHSDGSVGDKLSIIACNPSAIYLNGLLPERKAGDILAYAEHSDGLTQDMLDDSIFLRYSPLTGNDADIFLEMSNITGFELQSGKVMNS